MSRGASKKNRPGGFCLPGLSRSGSGLAPDSAFGCAAGPDPASGVCPDACGAGPVSCDAGPAPYGVGVDEAGRGCLAGPVVAAAAFFPEDFDFAGKLPGLDDSKRLSAAERERLADLIPAACIGYGIGLAWQDEIDSVNILNATFRAMSRAVLALAERLERPLPLPSPLPRSASRSPSELPSPSKLPPLCRPTPLSQLLPSSMPLATALPQPPTPLPLLLIDGDKVIPEAQWLYCTRGLSLEALAWEQYFPLPLSSLPERMPDLPRQMPVVGGDALLPCISAASVLAKTVRDGIMSRLDGHFPGYGFARHKGYGTREHLEAIEGNGPSALHRKSFRGVRQEPDKTGDGQLSLLDAAGKRIK